jgi:effector-binding domain-containing protein
MTRIQKSLFATAFLFAALTSSPLLAVEEAEYRTLKADGKIELREYVPSVVAETVVSGDFEDAGNRAFRRLFNYIDGNNESADKIAMTAPVSQEKAGQKIEMTAPVSQEASGDDWAVSFMMPGSFSLENTPVPKDPAVKIRQVPAYRAASIRYSGLWSRENYDKHLERLMAWMEQEGLEASGPVVWARYNGPFTPWFMRRNEILVPVASD